MVDPIDPTATGFLLAENRNMPMHVGGLQLFEKPEGAGRGYVREMYQQMRDVEQVAPLFLKHPHRSARTAGQLVVQRSAHAGSDYVATTQRVWFRDGQTRRVLHLPLLLDGDSAIAESINKFALTNSLLSAFKFRLIFCCPKSGT